MPFGVIAALALVAAVAVVVFLSAERHPSTWLLLVAVGSCAGGGALWVHAPSHRHLTSDTTEVVISAVQTPPASRPAASGPQGSAELIAGSSEDAAPVISTTGSGPNHVPAIAFLVVGVVAGTAGLIVKRRAGKRLA